MKTFNSKLATLFKTLVIVILLMAVILPQGTTLPKAQASGYYCNNNPPFSGNVSVSDITRGTGASADSGVSYSVQPTVYIHAGDTVMVSMNGTISGGSVAGSMSASVVQNGQTLFFQALEGDPNYGNDQDFNYTGYGMSGTGAATLNLNACNQQEDVQVAIVEEQPQPPIDFPFYCGTDQTVSRGQGAYYSLSASVPANSPDISVSINSSPGGVSAYSPYPMASWNSYSSYAYVDTNYLSPGQTYTLYFTTQQSWGVPQECQANLTIQSLPVSVDITFDGSQGPTTPNPSNGSSGELEWWSENSDDCTASGDWSGSVGANPQEYINYYSQNVSGLQYNTSYTYSITCTNKQGGSASDSVVVNVGPATPPTIDSFQCQGSQSSQPTDGYCYTDSGTNALIFFTSSNANDCTLNGDYVGTSQNGYSTGPLYNPPDMQWYGLFCAGPGGYASASLRVIVNAPPQQTISLNCTNSDGSVGTTCTVMRGTTTHLIWESSHCGTTDLTPGGPVDPNSTAGLDVVVNQSTQFSIACLSDDGYPGTVTAYVFVNVVDPPPPVSNTNCAPSPLVINKGGASGVISATVDSPGYSGGAITITPSFDTSPPANPPDFSYANNPQSQPGTTSVIVTAGSSASTGTFTLTLTATGSGIATSNCFVTLTVNGTPPDQPTQVLSNVDGACGVVTVNWNRPSTGPQPDYYQVYTLNTGNSTYQAVGPHIIDSGLSSGQFSYTDPSPLYLAGPNTYAVQSVSGSLSSSLASGNSVVPRACIASMLQSDKDLVRVGNNTSGSAVACDNISDTFTLSNQGIFISGTKVYFHINVCNTGSKPLTGLYVSETGHLNLQNIQIERAADGSDCVTSGTGEGPYYLSNMQPKINATDPTPVCTITVSANLVVPGGSTSYLFRFWNQATVYSNELPPKVLSTPKYLFSPPGGGGPPTRSEAH